MTSREFSVIGRKVNHLLPGYAVKGPLLFTITSDALLEGIIFDRSSRDRNLFRVHAFFLPLFVPTKEIRLNYSKTISPKSGQWDANDLNLIESLKAAIHMEAVPFLSATSTLRLAAAFIRPMTIPDADGYVSPYCQEALAYILIRLNDIAGALEILCQLQTNLNNPTAVWEVAMITRAKLMKDKILDNYHVALEQLELWKRDTLEKLRLDISHS